MPISSNGPSAPFPTGGEFLLNSTTAGDQRNPAVAALAGGGYAVLWWSGVLNSGTHHSLRAQILDADGNRVGGEIVVDSATDSIDDYQIKALAGGGFAIVWGDNLPGDGSTSLFDAPFGALVQVYSAAGVPLGAPLQVNTTTAGAQGYVQIAELTDGKFVVTWNDASEEVRARLFGADGSPLSPEFVVDTTSAYEQVSGQVTALHNGGFVVAWEDHSSAGGAGRFGEGAQIDVRAQYFDSNGARVGGEILVNTTTTASQSSQQLITLDGGNVLVAWSDYSSGSGSADVRGQLIDAAGNKVGGELLIAGAAGRQAYPVLQSLASGGFVAAWNDGSGQVAPRAQVFAADGSRVGAEIELHPAETYPRNVQIVRLADGGFAIGYDRSPTNDFFDRDSFVQVFTASGIPVGGPVQLHSSSSGNQSLGENADFAIGADGRLLAVWMAGVGFGTAPDIDLHARLFDTPGVQTGSAAAETLTGTAGIDLIYGFGGDDSISGLAGNDYLDGGAGADTLDGGAGNDTYYVDDPADMVIEAPGGGNDRIAASVSYQLAAGVEVESLEALNFSDTAPLALTGNELANRIAGNAGANFLDGGADNDRLEASAGDDYLIGGLGADQMYGGAGNDNFYVDNAGDGVFEAGGEGVDRVAAIVDYQLTTGADIQILEAITLGDTTPLRLVGNEIGQLVVGNAGDNLIDGGGGHDELIGLSGADTFRFANALGIDNVDHIQDFQSGIDRIALDDAVFTTLTPGALPAGAFVIGTAAGDVDDRIIYDQATGRLFYDRDGNGAAAAVQFATLNAGQALAASDFTVI